MLGALIRAYYQNPSEAPAGSVVIDSNANRWRQYEERTTSGDPVETPPLPPERTNSNPHTKNGVRDLDGHDAPPRSPPTAPAAGGGYTHHLIRDFMFLDAAAQNAEASGPPPSLAPRVAQQFTVRFLPLDPADFAGEDSVLAQFTRGTGHQRISNKHLLDVASVSGGGDLAFFHDGDVGLSFSTLLYELVDLPSGETVDGGQFSPNWFGVAVPDGVTDFTNVVIYFHPTPAQAGYMDPDYPSKTNASAPQANTYWKELLGYVDRLGAQLAGAVKHSHGTPNQIVIVPLMRNANLNGTDNAGHLRQVAAGVLPSQWFYIVSDILKDLPARLASL
jgi:hypothetical protein